ncbi:unnamed protein product [Ceutorhynchus assimilis]|uniref:Uncharacterized protein n=1 Tax=Ceutorhynchus assimilis TaxID=467358 RepID=A0A9P0GJF7_9CUCU|nr:unnamed protein product [Ceutorhynchus assimilis]
MEAQEDNSITVVMEPYSDANLNEKELSTQYIYTTEGELIPAVEDLNAQQADDFVLQEAQTSSTETGQVIVEELAGDEKATEAKSSAEEITENVTQENTDSGNELIIEEQLENNEDPKIKEASSGLNNIEIVFENEPTTTESLEAIEGELRAPKQTVEVAEVVDGSKEESLVIAEETATQVAVKVEKQVKPKGRKTTPIVPLHIMGHDVDNHSSNVVNGKSPKPRPGVKVPYRNLTSQIVSKEELENVIIERGRKKQEERQEQKFSRKLTSNLASKIGPESTPKKTKAKDTNGNQKIDNDMDLLAILEGEGDAAEEMPEFSGKANKETTPTDETNLKNLEREIALQQLHDLPNLVPTPKTRFLKTHKFKQPTTSATTTTSINLPVKSPIKSNQAHVKVNTALKTYSRKRKSSDAETTLSPKKTIVSSSAESEEEEFPIKSPVATYVTKSSRVIKKKVIWDPDETPIKIKPSPKPETKTPTLKTYSKEQKIAHPKNESKSADLPKKSADKLAVVEKKPTPKKIVQEKRASPKLATPKPKKSRSEVDKLLGDEGAIKMLYELQNSDTKPLSAKKTFKDVRKKFGQIKLEVVNSTMEKTKNLRKKETVSPQKPSPGGISRQKSKDSGRSTPPMSPTFSYSNETSYLIRRRSSDSIWSSDDLELDDTEERLSKKKPVATIKDPLEIKKPIKQEKSQKRAESKLGIYNNITLKKTNGSLTITLYKDDDKTYFTLELLKELTAALIKISNAKDYNVVLIKSSNPAIFSKGLDYTELISKKPKAIQQAAAQVQSFLQCLLDFPKILIAGIQGECVGLAVTMLPLFDIVIASDEAIFSLPHCKLGCPAEGGFLLGVPYMATNGLVGDLLYASQKLTADEVYRRGLISKLCWPEKYQDTIKSTVNAIGQGSRQGLEANKSQVRNAIRVDCQEGLDSLSEELIELWNSKECQSSFAKIE